MITTDPNSLCFQAQLFYYDFLSGEPPEDVPSEVLNHVNQCQQCQKEIDRLKQVLSDTGIEPTEAETSSYSDISTFLKLHFYYIGRSVTCNIVKPFLPAMASSKLKISIPTPINVHLDNCPACAKDFETIRQFKLNHLRLCRLARLFSEEFHRASSECMEAQKFIPTIAAMNFKEATAQILNHVCLCCDCRNLLYSERKARSNILSAQPTTAPFPCDEVITNDIFDYVVPYGIDPVKDELAEFQESLASHLHNCPNCLEKIQDLHNTIYTLMEREESGIITCFEVKKPEQKGIDIDGSNIYADGPIKVKVIDKNKTGEKSIGIASDRKPKRKYVPLNLQRLIKSAAAAAIILIVLGFLFYTALAGAIDFDRISAALRKIHNVNATRFYPAKPEPIQEIWVSRSLNIYLIKTGKEWVLWDISNGTRKVKNADAAAVEVASMAEDALAKVKKYIDDFVGPLPFPDTTELLEDFEWGRAPEEDIETEIPGTEVYDLIWSDTLFGGSIKYQKWRGYIDPETYLPLRTEFYERLSDEDDYVLNTVYIIEYPDDEKVKAVIRKAFSNY
ncbi:MAG: hypothetical protein AMJ78_04215 [Omnitrophica WOR_2 bacterium SM23_29]|nr:MAG: hypothetical protein AMJ78_04215 [Omnitrophica WOR_2 bacterium SM23_29]